MKKLLLSAAILMAAAGAATAADLPYRAPLAPFVPAAANWSGCYVGGHVGGGWAWHDHTNTANTTAFGDFIPGQGFANPGSGYVGGGHVGCNYQAGRLVFGIEGSYSTADIKGDYASVAGAADDVFTHRISDIATVVGRFGMAYDQWLYYTKLGWAGARATLSVVDTTGVSTGAGSDTHWHNGVTIGSGIEYGFTRNWIAGFETNYFRFEKKSYEVGDATGLYTFSARPRDVYTAVGRLSYKF